MFIVELLLFILTTILSHSEGEYFTHRNYSGIFLTDIELREIELSSSLSQSINANIKEVCHTESYFHVNDELSRDSCYKCVAIIRFINRKR